jgi:DNA-binding PadR family transcriptional regulator
MGTKNNNNSNMMLWRRLNVGSEIAVYSKEYKGYFACSVIKTKNKSSSLFQVEYEDDSTEWTDLSKVKFRWQDLDDEEFDSDNDDVDNDNNDDDDASDNDDDDDDDDKSDIDDYEEEDNKISDVDDDRSSDDTFKRKTTTSSIPSNKRMKKEEDNADDDNNDCEKDDRDKEEHTDINKLVVPKTYPTEDNGKNDGDDSPAAVMTNKDDGTKDGVNDNDDYDCIEEANEEEDDDDEEAYDDEDDTNGLKGGIKKKHGVARKDAKKAPIKKTSTKAMKELSDGRTTSTIKRLSSKEVKKAYDNKELTKQNALLHIMVNHHMVGTTYLTFEQIFKDLGFKPKNKAIEQAWKEVRAKQLVEEANVSDGAKKYFQLTPEGIDLVASEDYKHQLANPPRTTEELHEQIKKSANKYGVQIFDLLLKNGSMSTDELADKCGVSKKGHNFVHGFKQHKTFGYVIKDPNSKRASWILSPDKAFIIN